MKHVTRIIKSTLLALVLMTGIQLNASEEAHSLAVEAIKAIADNNYDEAVELLKEAKRSAPDDARVQYLLGVALNRTGQGTAALTHIYNARMQGETEPTMEYELGWGYYHKGEYDSALKHFQRYSHENLTHAKTKEFIGRCHYNMGNIEEAKRNLSDAKTLDPTLSQSADFYLALIKRDEQKSDLNAYVNEALAQDPANPFANKLQRMADTAKRKSETPWRATLSLGLGYNSNVLSLNDDLTPVGTSQQNSLFQKHGLSGSCDIYKTRFDLIQMGYSGNLNINQEDFEDANSTTHYLFGNYSNKHSDKLTLGLRISDQFISIGDGSDNNTLQLRPSARYNTLDWLVSEIAYELSIKSDSNSQADPNRDRSGTIHKISVTEYFNLPDQKLNGILGGILGIHALDGSDQEHTSFLLHGGVSRPLPWKTEGNVGYSLEYKSYANRQSEAVIPGGGHRTDTVHNISMELTRPLSMTIRHVEAMQCFLQYQFTLSSSSIETFESSVHMATTGIRLQF